jgi:hypothetical protein
VFQSTSSSCKTTKTSRTSPTILLVAVMFLTTNCSKEPKSQTTSDPQKAGHYVPPKQLAPSGRQDGAVVRALVDNEESILFLSEKIDQLSKRLLDLRLPGPTYEENSIFSDTVDTIDLDLTNHQPAKNAEPFDVLSWPLSSPSIQTKKIDLWRPMLDKVAYFDHAKLSILHGHHPDGNRLQFESTAQFKALAHMQSKAWHAFRGTIEISWIREQSEDDSAGAWQIRRWETKEMEYHEASKPLFEEILSSAVKDPRDFSRLRKSPHYAATVKHYAEGMNELPHPYFAPISVNQKEGIAVVDVNGDGWDDIYITMRIGRNMLLINQQDGTFREQAAEYKLNLPGHTTCAIFADFDNDGDQDVMLGRSLLKSSYLENRDGVFHQHPIPKFMPMAVISMSAADYNMDGLLDIYLCTYRPAAPASASPAGGVAQGDDDDFDWPDEFFDADLAREFRNRVSEHRQRKGGTVLDQLGPPNVLLVNRGNGNFEPAPENPQLGVWRNSLQATWGDYNEDGRPDLYIANDWGMDSLFRNESTGGFTDVSKEVGLTSYGYAMGASWGDYDNDGLEDLYVSNMYSEAGRRMTASIPGLDPMFVESAAGNWLYRKTGPELYHQKAGMQHPSMTVMNAGWSWGGCFTDFDNDTFLDLYVLSGYFTAPKELDSGLDMESNLWRTMIRTDPTLSRSTFRLSPEWKRTSAPDNLGPEIDARLAGVERQGERILVHSLNGSERNHYFANRNGQAFQDVSALSCLDNIADSRGFGVLDFDRDGWQDVALVNANEPLFNLYRNDMTSSGYEGNIIAIRFVGGNKQASPSKSFTSRDGFGARVLVDLGDTKLIREHRCGDGWSTQNSSTMLVGIGKHSSADSVTVTWPSGETSTTREIAEGTLLTAFENQDDSQGNEAFQRDTYRLAVPPFEKPNVRRSVFPVAKADKGSKPGFHVRVYTTFTTTNASFIGELPRLAYLRETLGPEGVEFIVVPVDETDVRSKLGSFASTYKPAARLLLVPPEQRNAVAGLFAKVFGTRPPIPSTIVTDIEGKILGAQVGLPHVSALRKLLETQSKLGPVRAE